MLYLPFDGQFSPSIPYTMKRASPQARGLLAWWPTLQQPSAQLRDQASGNNHGVMTGAVVSRAHGVMGQMHDYDGSSRFEITANNAFTGTLYSITGWFEADTVSGTQTLIKNDNHFIIRLEGASIVFYHWDSGGGPTSISEPVSASTLTHFACTYDQVALRIYLNGVELETSSSHTSAPGTGSSTVGIGAQPGGGEAFDGRIGALSFYNYALSTAQIMQLWLPQTRWDLYQPLLPTAYYVPAAAAAGQPMMARGRLVPGMRPVSGGGW